MCCWFNFPSFHWILPLINTSAPTYPEFYKNSYCVTAAGWWRCLKTVEIHSKSLSIIFQVHINSSIFGIYLQWLFFRSAQRAETRSEGLGTNPKMLKTASSELAHINNSTEFVSVCVGVCVL